MIAGKYCQNPVRDYSSKSPITAWRSLDFDLITPLKDKQFLRIRFIGHLSTELSSKQPFLDLFKEATFVRESRSVEIHSLVFAHVTLDLNASIEVLEVVRVSLFTSTFQDIETKTTASIFQKKRMQEVHDNEYFSMLYDSMPSSHVFVDKTPDIFRFEDAFVFNTDCKCQEP